MRTLAFNMDQIRGSITEIGKCMRNRFCGDDQEFSFGYIQY